MYEYRIIIILFAMFYFLFLYNNNNKGLVNMREISERKRQIERTTDEVWRERLMMIFIERISSDYTEADLWEMLSPFGEVMDIYILRR